MNQADGWSSGAFFFGMAIMYGHSIYDTRNSPCVYRHDWVIDKFNGNDQKRTCAALLKESNARIEAQQAQIIELTEQVGHTDATSIESSPSQSANSSSPVSEAPTLSAEVDPTLAHADDDDD
jgi:hypothetical protein